MGNYSRYPIRKPRTIDRLEIYDCIEIITNDLARYGVPDQVAVSLTEVIRTCLKDRILGTFWFVVLERRQPSVVLRTKIYSKIQPLRSENFKREDF